MCAGLGEYISGTILFEETLYDNAATGETFIELLKKQVMPAACPHPPGWHAMLLIAGSSCCGPAPASISVRYHSPLHRTSCFDAPSLLASVEFH